MKTILLALVFALACFCVGCGDDAQAAKPAPMPPQSGREAMAVDGKQPGRLETQSDGAYLLRFPNGKADRVSANEVILMPEQKGGK